MGDRANINASFGGRQSGTDGEAIMTSYGGGGVTLIGGAAICLEDGFFLLTQAGDKFLVE